MLLYSSMQQLGEPHPPMFTYSTGVCLPNEHMIMQCTMYHHAMMVLSATHYDSTNLQLVTYKFTSPSCLQCHH